MSASPLPQELYDKIIRELDDADDVRRCSLVCRSFVETCQKFLFTRIALEPAWQNSQELGGPYQTWPCIEGTTFRLGTLLHESPHLGNYVRQLHSHPIPGVSSHYDGNYDALQHSGLLNCTKYQILPALTNIRALLVDFASPIYIILTGIDPSLHHGMPFEFASSTLEYIGMFDNILCLQSLLWTSYCPKVSSITMTCRRRDRQITFAAGVSDYLKGKILTLTKRQSLDTLRIDLLNSFNHADGQGVFRELAETSILNVSSLRNLHIGWRPKTYSLTPEFTFHKFTKSILARCEKSLETLSIVPDGEVMYSYNVHAEALHIDLSKHTHLNMIALSYLILAPSTENSTAWAAWICDVLDSARFTSPCKVVLRFVLMLGPSRGQSGIHQSVRLADKRVWDRLVTVLQSGRFGSVLMEFFHAPDCTEDILDMFREELNLCLPPAGPNSKFVVEFISN